MLEAGQDLTRVFRQIHRLEDMLLRGTLPPNLVEPLLQRIVEQQFAVEDRIRVHEPLPSLAEQLQRISALNQAVWGGVVSEEQRIAAAALVSERPQRLNDFAVFHVEGRNPVHTVEMWGEVLSMSHPDFRWRAWCDMHDTQTLRLAEGTRSYGLGIHLVRLNLIAHWRPQDEGQIKNRYGHTVNASTLRRRTLAGEDVVPAHGEALSALGLSPDLVRAMRAPGLAGFPGQVMAGYMVDGQSTVIGVVGCGGVELTFLNDNYLAPYNAMPLVITDTEAGN